MAAGLSQLSYDAQGNVTGMYRLRWERVSYGNLGGFQFVDGVCGPVPGTRALRKLIAAMGHELTIERVDAPAADETPPASAAPPPAPRMRPSAVSSDPRLDGHGHAVWEREVPE